jgi:hypothetical protein
MSNRSRRLAGCGPRSPGCSSVEYVQYSPFASRSGLLAPPGLGPPFNTSLLAHPTWQRLRSRKLSVLK